MANLCSSNYEKSFGTFSRLRTRFHHWKLWFQWWNHRQ